jgi:hypothetical protein
MKLEMNPTPEQIKTATMQLKTAIPRLPNAARIKMFIKFLKDLFGTKSESEVGDVLMDRFGEIMASSEIKTSSTRPSDEQIKTAAMQLKTAVSYGRWSVEGDDPFKAMEAVMMAPLGGSGPDMEWIPETRLGKNVEHYVGRLVGKLPKGSGVGQSIQENIADRIVPSLLKQFPELAHSRKPTKRMQMTRTEERGTRLVERVRALIPAMREYFSTRGRANK